MQTAVWLETELVEWLDQEAINRERSRAWLINEAVRVRKQQLERRRKVSKE